jgi:hypothetical protein
MTDITDDAREAKNAAINAIISESLRSFRRSSRPSRRHPCEVTSDRLGDHLTQFGDQLTGADRDTISHVRHLLEGLARGGDQRG